MSRLDRTLRVAAAFAAEALTLEQAVVLGHVGVSNSHGVMKSAQQQR